MGNNTRKPKVDPDSLFGDAEALRLHQLRLLEWMATTGRKRFQDTEQTDEQAAAVAALPDLWKLTIGVEPYHWQQECIAKWRKSKGKGTAKVVTGVGKTLLALFIAESLQNADDEELRVVIVVPTIVLMHQWHDVIMQHGNLPPNAIGRLGGGYDEDLGEDRRILIAVLASASQRLPKLVKEADVGDHLLLVADECHRAGAQEMSKVFRTKRRWSLGLSATPEREDDEDSGYNKSFLGRALGRIIYEFSLADALREGLVPKFTIHHYGLDLTSEERRRYEALSRSITDAMSQLKGIRDTRSDGDFFSWARNVAARNQGEAGGIAMRFVSDTSKRRKLLNHMEARHHAVVKLIEQEFDVNPDARVILFHESIDDVMTLYACLEERGLPAIAEHSELVGSMRETGLDLFRRGIARIIVSARSLIEGFNVPAVDVGIIVASSGSVRQRIQSLGRVLRRHRGPSGEEKTSCIHVLYAADTSEESIYRKIDWNETTGVDQNKYHLWDLENAPQIQEGPPRTPLPVETQVDESALEPGSIYPGQYEGMELSCDSQRNVTNSEGQYAADTAELAEALVKVKGSTGKFRVTPKRRFVLVRVPSDDDWETLYVTRLSKPLKFGRQKGRGGSVEEAMEWARSAQAGDVYPFPGLAITDDDLRYKQKAGGVISKKVAGGEVFARRKGRAKDARRGGDAESLTAAIRDLRQSGRKVGRIHINESQHALFREAGQLFFILALEQGLEFPEER